jgi:hypothetical protein
MNNATIVDGPLTWPGDVYDFTQVEIVAPMKGKVFVNFDGTFYMNSEEKGLITTNLSSDWPSHPEMVNVELSTEHDFANFTHRKVYEVEAGTYNIHALAKKTEGGFDPFYDYLYGTVTVHFIADDQEATRIYSNLVPNNTVTDNNSETIVEIQFNAPSDGQVLVQFTGQITSSLDDRINVTLKEDGNPVDLGHLAIQPVLSVNPQTFFSVSGFAEVNAGSHSYEVEVEYDDVSNGSGTATLSGYFTVHFVDEFSTAVRDEVRNDLDAMVYPNPTEGMLFGQVLNTNDTGESILTLYNTNGEKVRQLAHSHHGVFQSDLTDLPDGQYLLRIENGSHFAAHVIVKAGNK